MTTTMQDLSSTVSFSPSFSFYASGNGDLVQTAVRVVRDSVKVDGDDDDFEFETSPLHEESFFHFPPTMNIESKNDDDVAASKNLFYGGSSWSIIDQSVVSSPSSESHSSSSESSEDLEDVSKSRFYCFGSPMRSPARSGVSSNSKSSTSKSSSEPKRCRIKEFLRRSHSDGAVSTTSETKRCRFKELLKRSHSDGGGNGSPVVKGNNKTVSYKPEVDKRRKSYLPYRQDLIGVFVGMSRFRH